MIVYHASQHKDLSVINPQRTLSNNKYIGDYVFATADQTLAAMYLVPKGFAILMNIEMSPPTLVVCGKKEDLESRDSGGAIYELSSDRFIDTPQEGLELYERVSPKPVEVLGSKVYASIFDAFKEYGIGVKFVDEATFRKLLESSEQQNLIRKL